jgi:transposase InsO family protein
MSKRTYDHRIRNAIAKSGNPSLFPELNILGTTAQQWIREGEKEVVTTYHFARTIRQTQGTCLRFAHCVVSHCSRVLASAAGIRIYPQKPKVGIRVSGANQICHLDQSLLRLKNGTTVFIRANVDNFSRRVLAWQVTDGYGGKLTKTLIEDACQRAGASKHHFVPNVLVDGGIENLNRHVDHLVQSGIIKRTIEQIDISFSNSVIESFFRTIKHRWPFMLSLDDLDSVRKHVVAFIEDYNSLIPHSALRGAKPLEMYLGSWLPA